MRDYIIVTDSDSELDLRYVQKYNLPVFAMPFTMDGVEYLYDLGVNVKIPDFFRRLGEGAEVSTSARPYWETVSYTHLDVYKRQVLQWWTLAGM